MDKLHDSKSDLSCFNAAAGGKAERELTILLS